MLIVSVSTVILPIPPMGVVGSRCCTGNEEMEEEVSVGLQVRYLSEMHEFKNDQK